LINNGEKKERCYLKTMENNKNFKNGMEYLRLHKEDRYCYVCGKKLEDFEQYLCIFCQEKVEQA
jgi:hypothetical protein